MNPLYLLIALLLLTYAIYPSGWIMGVIAGVVALIGFFKAVVAK
jgi:energy-coupling factor transporter transmembrane protein EcfT